MMTRAELKQEAKNTLRGRWGTAMGMVVAYVLVIVLISLASNFILFVGSIVSAVISIPLAFGFVGQMLKFSRNEQVGFFDFFSIGFKNFGRSWGILGNTILKLLGWFLACVGTFIGVFALTVGSIFTGFASLSGDEIFGTAAGIMIGIAILLFIVFYVLYVVILVKSYFYVLTDYIGNDNPEMPSKEVVERSKELMTGNRWRFFVLQLSFIGWAILSSLTLGIGYLWLVPYMEITTIKFYEDVAKSNKIVG